MSAKEFGQELRKIRLLKGFTMKQLAEKIEVSQPYISMLENGRKGIPKPQTLKKISESLDVSLHELMSIAGYIDDRTMIEEDFSNLNEIGWEIRRAKKDIVDYEERAKWAEENNVTEKGYTAEDFLTERDGILNYLDLLENRHTEIRQRLIDNPKTNDVFETRAKEAKKERNIWLYQERYHVRIEDFFKDQRRSFYINDHKLTLEEIRSLITLYGGKEKNYPTEDQLKKEYEAIKKGKKDFENELKNSDGSTVVLPYGYDDVDTRE